MKPSIKSGIIVAIIFLFIMWVSLFFSFYRNGKWEVCSGCPHNFSEFINDPYIWFIFAPFAICMGLFYGFGIYTLGLMASKSGKKNQKERILGYILFFILIFLVAWLAYRFFHYNTLPISENQIYITPLIALILTGIIIFTIAFKSNKNK
jgi:hypothetical protein